MTNPYGVPEARIEDLQDVKAEVGEVGLFRNSRIGRLRYLAYSVASGLLTSAVLITVLLITGSTQSRGIGASLAGIPFYVSLSAFQLWLAFRRSHDFNATGWLALLAIVPLANLVFVLIPGSPGANRFGPEPPPNNWKVVLLACSISLLALFSIIAAVALPTFLDYRQDFGAEAFS